MKFAVNSEKEMVRFVIEDKQEEVTFKFALQFATKIIDVLTDGNAQKMAKIMKE